MKRLLLPVAVLIVLTACGSPAPAASKTVASSSTASSASAGTNASEPKPEKAKIVIARSAPGGTFIPVMIAKEAGYFANHGLDTELLMVAPPAANQAMVSGSIATYQGATSDVTAILGGADAVYAAAPVAGNSQLPD